MQLMGGELAQLEPVLALVPFFVQNQRRNALFLQLVVAARQHVDIVALDLGAAVDVEGVVNIGLLGEGLHRRGLHPEAERDGMIGVYAVRRVGRPGFGLAVQQTQAQNQLLAVPHQFDGLLRILRLPAAVALRVPAQPTLLIAQPQQRLEGHGRILRGDGPAGGHGAHGPLGSVRQRENAVREHMEQRGRLRPQGNFQPQPVQPEPHGLGVRHAEDLRHRPAPGHQLQVDVHAAVVADAGAGIHNKAFGLFRAAYDDFLVAAPLNKALGLVFGVVFIPAGRLAVLHGHNPHRRGQQLHALRTNGAEHSVRAYGIVPANDVNRMFVVLTFRPQRQKRLRNLHPAFSFFFLAFYGESVHPKVQRFGQGVFFIRSANQLLVGEVVGNARLFGVQAAVQLKPQIGDR